MFKTVDFPWWTPVVVTVAFILIAGVFLAVVIRALRTPKKEIDRLSRLPLEDDPPSEIKP
jgi:cbb3-type cytochrome oxidase subunit 3